jgi:hypothetical protein
MRRRLLLIGGIGLALVLLLVGLALPPRARTARTTPPGGPLVRGALHVHTDRSDGTGTIDDVAGAARRAGLDFVVLADHGDATRVPEPPAYRAGVLCIDAVEISTTGGHYLALGLGPAPYRLAGEPRDVVEDVRRLGGFGVAAHPDSPKPELRWSAWDEPFDGLEWLNADSEWRDEPVHAIVRALATYLFRPPETIASLFDRPAGVLARWDALNRDRGVVGIAGHDAHARIGLRGNWEPAEGDVSLRAPSYEAAFRTFAVRVHLDGPWTGDAAMDAARLLAGIRRGALYTAIDALASGGWLEFTASADGRVAAAGEDLATSGAATLRARVADVAGLSLLLIRDGVPIVTSAETEIAARHEPAAGVAVYRVEAYIDGTPSRGDLPWIVGNPIRIGTAEALAPPEPAALPAMAVATALGEDAWRDERDRRSRSSLTRTRTPWGTEGWQLTYALGDGRPQGQYAAAVQPIARGRLREWHALSFVAQAQTPMRLSLQLRDPATGRRWARSVPLGPERVERVVPFADMRGVEDGAPPVALETVDSILFVVDTTNTVPGSQGTLWLGDLRLVEFEGGQVRTVSSR